GFEAGCEASLPAARIEVVTIPVVYRTNRTLSWRELTSMSGDGASELRAVGLTTAQIGHNASVESTGIQNERDGRICARPSIRVELSATPMTVYIGRENRRRPLPRRGGARARVEARRRLQGRIGA